MGPATKQPSSCPRRGFVAGALVCIGLLVGACGGGGPHSAGVASLGNKKTSSVPAGGAATTVPSGASVEKHYQQALKFSGCMRSHGIANFPDPSSTGGLLISSSDHIDPQSPSFQAAQKACQKYSPVPHQTQAQIAAHEASLLRFAACMRKNGVPDFADPTFGPQGQVDEKQGSGVAPNSSTFQAAARKCNS
jgi:hypothetical protein